MTEQANKRARIWALTINQGAPSFGRINDCINQIIGKYDKYALIYHDKDIDYTSSPLKLKEDHIHVLLTFENARGFNSVQKIFEGAHIEKAIGESAYANYLLHNDKPDKYQYPIEEIKTNNLEWFKSLLIVKAKELFIEDKLPYYILVEKCETFLKLVLRFGASQISYQVRAKSEAIKNDYYLLEEEEKEKVIEQLKEQFDNQ